MTASLVGAVRPWAAWSVTARAWVPTGGNGLLLAAARRLEPLDPGLARETYVDAFIAAMFGARLNEGIGVAQRALTRDFHGCNGPVDATRWCQYLSTDGGQHDQHRRKPQHLEGDAGSGDHRHEARSRDVARLRRRPGQALLPEPGMAAGRRHRRWRRLPGGPADAPPLGLLDRLR